MRARSRNAKLLRVGVPLGVGALALIAGVNGPLAQMSEMDGFDRAITTGTKEDALAFISDFRSSHLVPDLIELLPPDVAAAVCAELGGSGSNATDRACDQIMTALTAMPAAGITAPDVVTTEQAPVVVTTEQDDETQTQIGPESDEPGNRGDAQCRWQR